MERNTMAYLQLHREERLDPPYLGCVGSENRTFPKLSDEETTHRNQGCYAVEVQSMLNMLSQEAGKFRKNR